MNAALDAWNNARLRVAEARRSLIAAVDFDAAEAALAAIAEAYQAEENARKRVALLRLERMKGAR